jgi:hypothetical protein
MEADDPTQSYMLQVRLCVGKRGKFVCIDHQMPCYAAFASCACLRTVLSLCARSALLLLLASCVLLAACRHFTLEQSNQRSPCLHVRCTFSQAGARLCKALRRCNH